MNKKLFFSFFMAAGMTATGIMAATGVLSKPAMPSPMQEAPPAEVPQAADNELLTLYGSLEQSNAWQTTPAVGFYTLNINDNNDPKAVSATQGVKLATGGGAYYDGHVYYINGSATYISVNNDFMILDVDQWKVIGGSNHKTPTKTDSYCMAYDYSTGQMYASSADRAAGKYYLRTVDLKSGEFTDVCQLGHYFPAMAFDASGQLWGFRQETDIFPKKVSLYKIDKNTGATTFVGDLGYNQKSDYSCAVFDYRTGKLYWSARTYTYNKYYEEFYVSYICEVDTETGKATPVKTFNNCEVFSILFFKDCHPKAPEAASQIAFNVGSDYTKGTIDFDVPSRRYDRSTLTGQVKAEIFVDGTLKETLTGLTPGTRASGKQISLSKGEHKVRIYLYDSNNNKSCAADFTAWSGVDVPGKVTDIKLEVTPRGDKATITWSAPTEGKTGGHFNSANMTYRIVRRPDFTTIATGLKETTFTDTPDRVMKLSQYEIYAETGDGASDPAYSEAALIGKPYPMTYLETFDSAAAFNTYTLIDVNGVGAANGDRWMWFPQYQCAIYWLNYGAYNAADAWLITPTLDLEAEKVYRYSFLTRGYSSIYDTHNLSAHVGALPTAQSMKSAFMRVNNVAEKDWTSYSALFVAEEGDCRIGLHLTSDGKDHCGIDNVRVAYYGPATIPGAPTVVSTGKDGMVAQLTVKAPDVDAKGRQLSSSITKLSLYRTGETTPVAVVENPTPGKDVLLEDPTPVAGTNHYIITATNSDGEGMEASASINMLSPKPVAVENLVLAVDATGNDVSITWQYPQGYPSATGEELKPNEIVYDVYRTIDGSKVQVVRDLKTTSYLDTNVTEAFPDNRQKDVTYHVVAKTSGGEAPDTKAKVLAGRPFEMPVMISEFLENNYTPTISSPVTAWSPSDVGFTPRTSPYKGSSFLRCYDDGVGTQTWTMPRINLTGLNNPTLYFMMYCTNSAEAETASLQIGMVVDKNGIEQPLEVLPASYSCKADADGWKQIEVDLSAYASYSRASIVFVAHATKQHNVYIDDIQITGEKVDRDMRITRVSGPSSCIMGRENTYYAVVHNNGKLPIDNAIVSFTIDGKEVYSEKISAEVDEQKSVRLDYVPDFSDADFDATLEAVVTTENDGNKENDREMMRIEVVRPNVPYVHDLAAVYDSNTEEVTLTWSEAVKYPRANAVKEDFDSYADFLIDNIGDWTLVDRDGAATVVAIQGPMGQLTWTNAGVPQAYIVFNPKKVGVTGLATAYSGEKCLVAFCAAKTNDDWLISPQLLGQEQEISFYARAMNPNFPNEKFDIMYSNSGTDISDFKKLKGVAMNSATWTNYKFTLPDGARYFAIRCTSNNQYALMLDDIEYIPAQPAVDLLGYKVYRNGNTLQESIGETEYVDKGVKIGDKHTYHVSALYADGESIRSNAAIIEATSVDGVAAEGVKVFSTEGFINILGAEGQRVVIATVDGKMLYNFKSTGADRVAATPAVYVIKVGNASYKLLVK